MSVTNQQASDALLSFAGTPSIVRQIWSRPSSYHPTKTIAPDSDTFLSYPGEWYNKLYGLQLEFLILILYSPVYKYILEIVIDHRLSGCILQPRISPY